MNAGALVYCLLDADGDYTPEGYRLLDTAQAGDYELKLWEGRGHVKGEPVKFNEVSLNAKGRSFDPASQAKKFPGSVHALGHRWEFLNTIANWIKRYGILYVGSYEPSKLSVYHRMFQRYLSRLKISEPYAAFDECEGKPEYFSVTGDLPVIESILEEGCSDADVHRYVNSLPDWMSKAVDAAKKMYAQKVESGVVNGDNFGELAEGIARAVVDKFQLTSGDEVVDIRVFNSILNHIL